MHRPVTLELTSGEQVAGLLVGNEGDVYLLRVEDRSVAIHDTDVVQVVYRGGPSAEVDAHVAGSEDESALGPMRTEHLPAGDPSALTASLLAGGRRTVALLDGARVPALAGWLALEDAPPHQCLFDGLTGPDAAAAPHLVELAPGGFLDWLGNGFLDECGVVFETPCALPALAAFLRSFVRVVQPSGAEVHFRFYDPRVLRPWLKTLNRYDVGTLFGAAWTGVPGGAAEACCPICDEVLPPLRASWCGVCEAALGGSESAPFLIEALLVPADVDADEPAELLRCQPWPEVPTADGVRPPQRRPARRPRRGSRPLVLREEQAGAIEAEFREREFEEFYLGRLRRTMPERFAKIGEKQALQIIRQGRARAAQFGMDDPESATTFLDVCFVWHPRFDEKEGSEYREVLDDPEISAWEKAEAIWEIAVEGVAIVRRAQGDPVPADEVVKPLLE